MMRGRPHEGEKQRGKSSVTPCDPDGYALSPKVATRVCTFCALFARSTLSTMTAVDSSPAVPHTAISPAPTRTGAPASTTSSSCGPAGVGDGFFSREQALTTIVSAPTQIANLLEDQLALKNPLIRMRSRRW